MGLINRNSSLVRAGVIGVAVLGASFVGGAGAQAPSTQPSSPLVNLSTETQKLYNAVREGMVIVRLPDQMWLAVQLSENDPLRYDGRIDPALRRKLLGELQAQAKISPATQSSTTAPIDQEFVSTGPRLLGLVVSDRGHIVIPVYVDPQFADTAPISVSLNNGRTIRAKYVGGDSKTNLTVLQVEESPGSPVLLGEKPSEGALVLTLAANHEAGKLLVWTGMLEENVIVADVAGRIAGFSRDGQFLSGSGSRIIIDQLIQHGKVRRAALGVWIAQTLSSEGRPIVVITRVFENQPAEKAGLRQGDIVVSLNGQAMSDVQSFAAAVAVGQGSTPIEVVRDGKRLSLSVDLKSQ